MKEEPTRILFERFEHHRMIAIHTKTGSFVPAWVRYCKEQSIPFIEVDCFASDIIEQVKGCDALLWNWAHHDYRAQLFARQLIASIEQMGLLVFPSAATCWHFDDKVGQKYLLEAVEAPIAPTYVFYERDRALKWIESTSFPKVWKLRGGAGSQNVRLVKTKREARRAVAKSFGRGWSNSRFHSLKDRIWQWRRDRTLGSFVDIGRGIVRAFIPHEKNRKSKIQRDYVYFQDFIPDNDCDIRVVVIGDRAFAIKRMVRGGDFRASGSGSIRYERDEIPEDCIRIAFEVTRNIKSQSCAFDFVQRNGEWLIIEISYAFSLPGYTQCPGYWDRDLEWHEGTVTPEQFMIEDLLADRR